MQEFKTYLVIVIKRLNLIKILGAHLSTKHWPKSIL